ncbi:hypothetical protein TL16_g07367, partial [Triparma laevis f. inornata]
MGSPEKKPRPASPVGLSTLKLTHTAKLSLLALWHRTPKRLRRGIIVLLLILFFLYNYLYFLPLSSGIILSSYSAMTDAKAFNSLQLQCMKMSQVAVTANRLHSTKAAGTFDTRHTYTEVDKLMPIENRVQYYTEPALPHYLPPTTPQPPITPINQDNPLNPIYVSDRDYDGYVGKYWSTGPMCVRPKKWVSDFKSIKWMDTFMNTKITYFMEVYHAWTKWGGDIVCLEFGDSIKPLSHPCLRKTRLSPTSGSAIVFKQNFKRHWEGVAETLLSDTTEWSKKSDKAIWRGATTGHPWPQKKDEEGNWAPRANLVQNIPKYDTSKIDVAVTRYVQNVPNLWGSGWGRTQWQLMGYKMLIMVEGNDVATGLKWALVSSCAVIMPKPRVVSWLMEDKLVPWVHYIPVEPNFEDLEEKVDWCLKNGEKCREIGHASRCFMMQFFDTQREDEVQRQVWQHALERQAEEGTCV